MEPSIVRAIVSDAADIVALQKAAYQSEAKLYDDWTIPPLTQTLSLIEAEFDMMIFLKAIHQDVIVGSVRALSENDTCFINRLIVAPQHQRKGVGTQLMQRIERQFPQVVRFELFTGSRSQRNIRFYQRLGYRAFREQDLSPKVRLVFMEKQQSTEG